MSIESLKQQARRHEQKEEWQKALDLYRQAIARLAEEDQPDIGLYNRAGDLCVRIGNLEAAVGHYEQAVDLYVEAELPNNAIAICKKVIRNLPHKHSVYLKMGQIRARQGFIPDARVNFLTYAERMQQEGDLGESFRALVEFADLAPEDVEVRLAVADQMANNDRTEEAVDQLGIAYRALVLKGESSQATDVEARIRELNPEADLSAAPEGGPVVEESGFSGEGEIMTSFGEIAALGPEPAERAEEEISEPSTEGFEITHGARSELMGAEEEEEEEEAEPLPTFGLEGEEEEEEEEEEEAEPLPTFGLEEEEEEEEAEPLPTFALEEEEEEEETEAPPLPMLDVGPEEVASAESFDLEAPPIEESAPETTAEVTLDTLRTQIEVDPDDVALRQRMVELAYREGEEAPLVDAFLGLAEALQHAGQTAQANAAYQQALDIDPDNEVARAALEKAKPAGAARPAREVASSEDYVDLGSLILEDESQKTTRFVVASEAPSGDEQADFAKMLSQFKEKVSENLDAQDVRAHYDLGTAYKEMGLLDEAIAEFQQALRASADHLPTYELLGQTFLEMDNADAAVRSLKRALEAPFDVEDELIGIYYYLARAYESLGDTTAALEYYDQVFSLDINFADVTERLRALR